MKKLIQILENKETFYNNMDIALLDANSFLINTR